MALNRFNNFRDNPRFRSLAERANEHPNGNPRISSVGGINSLSSRLQVAGGTMQEDRMIEDKRKTLLRALKYSYQRAYIKNIEWEENKSVRALINPNKLKQDYDDKILSVEYDHGFEPGDVFEWKNTGTYWLIYLQDLTELAYFRGDIRKCSYTIDWEDEEGRHSTYAAVRGPVETKINFIQKHGISVDEPNHSLNILMPKNEETLKYFQRYSKFYLQDNMDEYNVCWRVEATDWISMPGVLEINAVEYYANETEDDIEGGIVGARIKPLENPNAEEIDEAIKGDTFIKPKMQKTYIFTGRLEANWGIEKGVPVKFKIDEKDPKKITLYWDSSYSGQFDLTYGDFTKVIVVQSLF